MNALLKELIQKNIDDPINTALAGRIRDLARTETMFSNDLFESFEPEARTRVYSMVLIWCAPDVAEKVLNRRLGAENDAGCRLVAERVLCCARGIRDRVIPQRKVGTPAGKQSLAPRHGSDLRLRPLVQHWLEHAADPHASARIEALKPTDHDFTDELLDSFDAEARGRIYGMLLVWCGLDDMEKILERRLRTERDAQRKIAVDVMLRVLRDPRDQDKRRQTLLKRWPLRPK